VNITEFNAVCIFCSYTGQFHSTLKLQLIMETQYNVGEGKVKLSCA